MENNVFVKVMILQYCLSSSWTAIPVNIYKDIKIVISSFDTSFHFLQREWDGNSRLANMYWGASRFVCVQTSLGLSFSTCFLDEAIEAFYKLPLVWDLLFLEGNSLGVTAVLFINLRKVLHILTHYQELCLQSNLQSTEILTSDMR